MMVGGGCQVRPKRWVLGARRWARRAREAEGGRGVGPGAPEPSAPALPHSDRSSKAFGSGSGRAQEHTDAVL